MIGKRRTIAMVIIAVAELTHAAQAQPVQLDIKGLALGQTKADVIGQHNLFCRDSFCMSTNTTSTLGTFAGAPVETWFFHFDESEQLVRLGLNMKPNAATIIISALTEKYGKPQIQRVTDFKTVGGASTKGIEAAWTQGDSELKVESPATKITEMRVTLTSVKHRLRKAAELEQKAKKDL